MLKFSATKIQRLRFSFESIYVFVCRTNTNSFYWPILYGSCNRLHANVSKYNSAKFYRCCLYLYGYDAGAVYPLDSSHLSRGFFISSIVCAGYFPGHGVCGCVCVYIKLRQWRFRTHSVSFSVYPPKGVQEWKWVGGWWAYFPDSNPTRPLHLVVYSLAAQSPSSHERWDDNRDDNDNNQFRWHFVLSYDVLQLGLPTALALCLRLPGSLRRSDESNMTALCTSG